MTENSSIMRFVNEEDRFDRISELPDPILSHILSLLPTEDVAGITLLSKRLKSLWSPLSILDLNFNRFSKSYSNLSPEDRKKRFTGFVESMIAIHQGRHLQEIRLVVDISKRVFGRSSPVVRKWVLFALTSNSTALDLEFCGGREGDYYHEYYDYELPPCSSIIRSVTNLKLTCCEFVPLRYKGFESLTTLSLSGVDLPEDSVNDLINVCPALEELHLEQCSVPAYFELDAPKSKLKCFVMESCCGHDDEKISDIRINVPSLLKFKFGQEMLENFDVRAKNLIEADICFQDNICSYEHHIMIHGLLADLSNVHTLKLCDSALTNISKGDNAPVESLETPLRNLKHLSVETSLSEHDTKDFACLLMSSPNLETLCIRLSTPCFLLNNFWESLPVSFECLHHLKTIEIKPFVARSSEVEFLSYMLKNALVLKKVVIKVAVLTSTYGQLKPDEAKLLRAQAEKTKENILALTRASPDAQIVF